MPLIVDSNKCQGHGRCTLASPEVFEMDDEGYAQVLIADPGPEFDGDVEAAIGSCPEQAISRS